MSISLQLRPWISLLSRSHLKKKSRNGTPSSCLLVILSKSGSSVKANGCICSLYSTAQISWSNCPKSQRDSSLLIQLGDISLIKQSRHQISWLLAQKKDLRRNSKRLIRTWKSCKRVLLIILRRKDQSSLASISSLMMNYLKSYLKQRKWEMWDHI